MESLSGHRDVGEHKKQLHLRQGTMRKTMCFTTGQFWDLGLFSLGISTTIYIVKSIISKEKSFFYIYLHWYILHFIPKPWSKGLFFCLLAVISDL